MKAAITANGKTYSSAVDRRFGRAAGFVIYDTETHSLEYKDNSQNLNAAQGAGVQAAQNVADAGVQAVITGHCGPKAFHVLSQAGVEVYTTQAQTVEEAIDLFRTGKLAKASQADVEGHWI
ncbi:NifB/NifX family molybdenum-iron cluster-binding protein [Sedimentisphaera salicampi]|uniref:Dinitrogenase iron-molybdenum cofactor n=1 Tax=Sedimentisphaera salicampi TaxID=1941349 RepID=A0A1W6LMU8_9BACT|nr:NifB/NifX family molybdenum-iron cluster-binding protein [Sedimentisphaera salicampi]ARN57074.1 Dinitrogenase iron-molybdenum cofactor [Sedimentisphaera salicampi]OXU14913.1 Dinitrogenase iron-molybdenum cofactor [Sedimentisphaera salicampi]